MLFYQRWPLEAFLYHRIVSCVLKKSIARPYGFKLWLIRRQSLKTFAKIISVTSIPVYILYITIVHMGQPSDSIIITVQVSLIFTFSLLWVWTIHALPFRSRSLGLSDFLSCFECWSLCPPLLLSSSCGLSVAHACPPCHVSEYWQKSCPVLVLSIFCPSVLDLSVVHSCPTFPVQVLVQSCAPVQILNDVHSFPPLLILSVVHSCPHLWILSVVHSFPPLLVRVLSIPVLLGWFWAFPLMFFPSCSKSWQLLSCCPCFEYCPLLSFTPGFWVLSTAFFPSWFWVSANPVLLSWI